MALSASFTFNRALTIMIMIILTITLQVTIIMTNTYQVFAKVRTLITSCMGYGSDV